MRKIRSSRHFGQLVGIDYHLNCKARQKFYSNYCSYYLLPLPSISGKRNSNASGLATGIRLASQCPLAVDDCTSSASSNSCRCDLELEEWSAKWFIMGEWPRLTSSPDSMSLSLEVAIGVGCWTL